MVHAIYLLNIQANPINSSIIKPQMASMLITSSKMISISTTKSGPLSWKQTLHEPIDSRYAHQVEGQFCGHTSVH